MLQMGDIYYSDYVGWHLILIEPEVKEGFYRTSENPKYKSSKWIKTFIIEENKIHFMVEEDFTVGSAWTKVS